MDVRGERREIRMRRIRERRGVREEREMGGRERKRGR